MRKSQFTGSAWGLFGWQVLLTISVLLFVIPIVFVFPLYVKWLYEHLEIDGKQLEFDYDGPWWGLLGWSLFAFITFGIGSFYATKRIIQFMIKHAKIKGESTDGSEFAGSAWYIFLFWILWGLCGYAFFIPLAFLFPYMSKYMVTNTKYSGRVLKFTSEDIWWGAYGWFMLAVLTFGFGAFYAQKRMIQWIVNHTNFEKVNERIYEL
ncbi:MAG: DUF898 domain-containing protein [Bacilli bacterium]|nr:DUF898 domain-containing protein [Bacilli bacterium]